MPNYECPLFQGRGNIRQANPAPTNTDLQNLELAFMVAFNKLAENKIELTTQWFTTKSLAFDILEDLIGVMDWNNGVIKLISRERKPWNNYRGGAVNRDLWQDENFKNAYIEFAERFKERRGSYYVLRFELVNPVNPVYLRDAIVLERNIPRLGESLWAPDGGWGMGWIWVDGRQVWGQRGIPGIPEGLPEIEYTTGSGTIVVTGDNLPMDLILDLKLSDLRANPNNVFFAPAIPLRYQVWFENDTIEATDVNLIRTITYENILAGNITRSGVIVEKTSSAADLSFLSNPQRRFRGIADLGFVDDGNVALTEIIFKADKDKNTGEQLFINIDDFYNFGIISSDTDAFGRPRTRVGIDGHVFITKAGVINPLPGISVDVSIYEAINGRITETPVMTNRRENSNFSVEIHGGAKRSKVVFGNTSIGFNANNGSVNIFTATENVRNVVRILDSDVSLSGSSSSIENLLQLGLHTGGTLFDESGPAYPRIDVSAAHSTGGWSWVVLNPNYRYAIITVAAYIYGQEWAEKWYEFLKDGSKEKPAVPVLGAQDRRNRLNNGERILAFFCGTDWRGDVSNAEIARWLGTDAADAPFIPLELATNLTWLPPVDSWWSPSYLNKDGVQNAVITGVANQTYTGAYALPRNRNVYFDLNFGRGSLLSSSSAPGLIRFKIPPNDGYNSDAGFMSLAYVLVDSVPDNHYPNLNVMALDLRKIKTRPQGGGFTGSQFGTTIFSPQTGWEDPVFGLQLIGGSSGSVISVEGNTYTKVRETLGLNNTTNIPWDAYYLNPRAGEPLLEYIIRLGNSIGYDDVYPHHYPEEFFRRGLVLGDTFVLDGGFGGTW